MNTRVPRDLANTRRAVRAAFGLALVSDLCVMPFMLTRYESAWGKLLFLHFLGTPIGFLGIGSALLLGALWVCSVSYLFGSAGFRWTLGRPMLWASGLLVLPTAVCAWRLYAFLGEMVP